MSGDRLVIMHLRRLDLVQMVLDQTQQQQPSKAHLASMSMLSWQQTKETPAQKFTNTRNDLEQRSCVVPYGVRSFYSNLYLCWLHSATFGLQLLSLRLCTVLWSIILCCIVFIHFYSASHSLSLSEVLPTTAIDTVSEFTPRSAVVWWCHPVRPLPSYPC